MLDTAHDTQTYLNEGATLKTKIQLYSELPFLLVEVSKVSEPGMDGSWEDCKRNGD